MIRGALSDRLSPDGRFGPETPVVPAVEHWMLGREFVRNIK